METDRRARAPGEDSLAVLAEVQALRLEAARRYSEADLLVAALREHIADLEVERERLLAQLLELRDELRREGASWFLRGSKPARLAGGRCNPARVTLARRPANRR